jgi:hypothetical protein
LELSELLVPHSLESVFVVVKVCKADEAEAVE